MKILIYGAGVLGSYMAHIFCVSGHDVTILARGARSESINSNGLKIRHHLQKKITIDNVNVVEELFPDAKYDITFVVMQYTQVKDVLPHIAASNGCENFVFVGNNPDAIETQVYISEHSSNEKQVFFGFLSVGGRRENGEIISIHAKVVTDFVWGSLSMLNESARKVMEQVFANTDVKVIYEADINSYLISHLAFVLPLAFACYAYNGKLKEAFNDKAMRYKTIRAIDEGFQIVEKSGLQALPKSQVDLVRNKKKRTSLGLKLVGNTAIGALAISDHTMGAKGEMKELAQSFRDFRNKINLKTPNWEILEKELL